MNSTARNHADTPVQSAAGNGKLAPTSEHGLWPGKIASSAWEGWWWVDYVEESATDSKIGPNDGS
jgi:hypothetical protein